MKNDKVERFWHTVYYRFLSIICVDYDHVQAVAYLGGHGAMPPLWSDHENFLQATLYEKVRFLPFSSKFQKKMGKFAASIERSKAKSVSASGGLCPLTLDQGLCPGARWGLRPQTPHIGSRSARSPCPPLPNPKYATVCRL